MKAAAADKDGRGGRDASEASSSGGGKKKSGGGGTISDPLEKSEVKGGKEGGCPILVQTGPNIKILAKVPKAEVSLWSDFKCLDFCVGLDDWRD